jgi:hypothetical protein
LGPAWPASAVPWFAALGFVVAFYGFGAVLGVLWERR